MLDAFYLFEDDESQLASTEDERSKLLKQRAYMRTYKELKKNGIRPKREWLNEMRDSLTTPKTFSNEKYFSEARMKKGP
jgi:hypothetical protein